MGPGAPTPAERSRSPAAATARGGGGGGGGASIIPIIDVTALRGGGDRAAKLAAGKEIGRACEDVGFFLVRGHGIPKDVIDGAWEATRAFFDLPAAEKRRHISPDDAEYPYGYSPLCAEDLAEGKRVDVAGGGGGAAEEAAPSPQGDLKEAFNIGPSDARSGMPPRRWPDRPEGFSEALGRYYDEATNLAMALLGGFELALGLEQGWFNDKVDRHISALRTLNYPDQAGMRVPPGSIRCSAHTDYGVMTILKSGGPGLQVAKDKANPVWHEVPYVEDTLVINLGDLMRRWTNEKWSSTLHRVVNPPEGDAADWGRRMSMAFFFNTNKDTAIQAIPSCVSEDRPAIYDEIVAGDFLMLKYLASQGKADPDAHLRVRGGG